jgi:hypothetical protein
LGREKIRDIMLYRNPTGYSFRYLHPEVLCMPGEERTRPHKEIDTVCRDLRKTFLAQSNARSNPQDLQRIAKSGFASCRELFEHLLKFLPPEKIEDIFKDIYFQVYSVSGTLAEVSLPLFKFLINNNKVGIDYSFGVFMRLMHDCSPVNNEKIKFLIMKYDCVDLFRSQFRERSEKVDTEGEKIIRAGVENKCINSHQLQDLFTYMQHEGKDLVKCLTYLSNIINRQALTTLLGIFKHKRSPIVNLLGHDVVQVMQKTVVGRLRAELDVKSAAPSVPRAAP